MLRFRPQHVALVVWKGQKAGRGGCPLPPWTTSALLNAAVQFHACLVTVAALISSVCC